MLTLKIIIVTWRQGRRPAHWTPMASHSNLSSGSIYRSALSAARRERARSVTLFASPSCCRCARRYRERDASLPVCFQASFAQVAIFASSLPASAHSAVLSAWRRETWYDRLATGVELIFAHRTVTDVAGGTLLNAWRKTSASMVFAQVPLPGNAFDIKKHFVWTGVAFGAGRLGMRDWRIIGFHNGAALRAGWRLCARIFCASHWRG